MNKSQRPPARRHGPKSAGHGGAETWRCAGCFGHQRSRFCSGVPDSWDFGASSPCLFVGGYYYQGLDHGLFYVYCNTASNSNANIGSRLLASASYRSLIPA